MIVVVVTVYRQVGVRQILAIETHLDPMDIRYSRLCDCNVCSPSCSRIPSHCKVYGVTGKVGVRQWSVALDVTIVLVSASTLQFLRGSYGDIDGGVMDY